MSCSRLEIFAPTLLRLLHANNRSLKCLILVLYGRLFRWSCRVILWYSNEKNASNQFLPIANGWSRIGK